MMLLDDFDAAWANWSDDDLLRWAERRGYRQMGRPFAKVRLMTTSPDEADEARLYFRQWRVERYHSALPSPSQTPSQHSEEAGE